MLTSTRLLVHATPTRERAREPRDVKRERESCRMSAHDITPPLLVSVLMIAGSTGFVCPCCEEVTNIFSSGGGEALGKSTSRDRATVARPLI